MNHRGRYMRNVRMLTLFAPFKALSVSAAYLTPFFVQKGLDLSQIFLLQTIFSLAVVAWEVPSGIVADRFGRARCIKLSVPLAAAAMIGYAFSDSYWLFVIWELLLAIASGLYSGVDEALLRDSLRAEGYQGKELEHRQAETGQLIDVFGYLSLVVGVLIALALVTWVNVSATLLADGILTAIGGVFAFRLTEAPRYNGGQTAVRLSAWRSIRELGYNVEARWLVGLSSVLNAATYLGFWLSAPYYTSIGIPTVWFSLALALRSLFKAWMAHRYRRQRKLARNMAVYSALAGLTYLAMASHQWWLLPAVLGHDIVQALQRRPLTARLNSHMHPDYLATMNSLVSLVQRLVFAVAGPVVGYVVDHRGLSTGLVVTGAVCSTAAFLALWRLNVHGSFDTDKE